MESTSHVSSLQSRKDKAGKMNDVGELQTEQKPFVVAAIAAYNEERTIAKVILQSSKCVDKVVVCDDGSTDMTCEIARQVGADVVRHETNLGYGAAIQSLFDKAKELKADALVTLDGDGQHDPSEIPLVLEPVLQGKADIVIGSRYLNNAKKTNNAPRYREIGIKMSAAATYPLSKIGLSDAHCGFRSYNRKALESFGLYEWGKDVNVEILTEAERHGLAVAEVPTCRNYQGLEKTSNHNPLKNGASVPLSIVRWIVENRPLLILGVPGFTSLLIGVSFGVWLLQIYALERQIATNVALASIAFIFIGLFSIFTGIMLYAISGLVQKSSNRH